MSPDGQDGSEPTGPNETPYVITRGSPPREHQFQPGQSGNPRGRPRGSKDFRTLLLRELDRNIKATVNGQSVKMTKREAMAMRLMDQALKGDLKAIEACLKHSGETESSGPALPPMDTDPNRDAEILAAYVARRDGEAGNA